MTIEGEALLVRIYIGESDTRDGRPLYDWIVRHLRERGIRGVSVFRGIEGFGRSSRVHTTRILALSEDLPILIEAVDEADRIRAILPDLEPVIGGGLVTLEHLEVVVYRSGRAEGAGGAGGAGGGEGPRGEGPRGQEGPGGAGG